MRSKCIKKFMKTIVDFFFRGAHLRISFLVRIFFFFLRFAVRKVCRIVRIKYKKKSHRFFSVYIFTCTRIFSPCSHSSKQFRRSFLSRRRIVYRLDWVLCAEKHYDENVNVNSHKRYSNAHNAIRMRQAGGGDGG